MNRARIAKVGNKLFDLGTTNKSFLKIAHQLKILGVKNYYFMLEIKDPGVIEIDPYACDKDGHPTLTQDQVARVMNEIATNPWYYLREISIIPEEGGSGVHYIANRGNIAQAWCILHNLDSWLCIPRRQGKTQSAIAAQTWLYNFGTSNSSFLFMNKQGDATKVNLKRFKDQIDLLPEYLRFKTLYNEDTGKYEKGKDSTTQLSNPVTNNTIILAPKASSAEAGMNIGRGYALPIIHSDETEFTPYIDVILSNGYPAYLKSHEIALANGAFSARVLTSTPGDLDTNCGQRAEQMRERTCKWTEKMYDWSMEEIEQYFEAQGKDFNHIIYIEYSYQQLGLSDQWFLKMSQGMEPMDVRRDLLLQRLHGSSMSPYPREDMEYIVQVAQQPNEKLTIWVNEYYRFDVYKQLDKRKPYLIGVDCSTGTLSDNNAITILDPVTVEPVAEFLCSYIGETKFERLLISLIQDYLPRSVLCIERNSVGDGIIDHLLHSPIAGNLYYDKQKDLMAENMKNNQTVESLLKKEAGMKRYYGVYTERTSRDTMFKILARHINEYKEKFVTQNITSDITKLVRTSSGKIAASDGL